MKATSCFIAIITMLFIFSFSQAHADFDVAVDSNLAEIAISLDDTTATVIPFKDGVATWITKPDGKFAIGFYTEASLKKVAQTEKVYTVSTFGVKPNIGNIYLVIQGISEKDNNFYAWPVQFSPFGVGFHASNGKICHCGLVLFGPHAFQDMTQNKKLF